MTAQKLNLEVTEHIETIINVIRLINDNVCAVIKRSIKILHKNLLRYTNKGTPRLDH